MDRYHQAPDEYTETWGADGPPADSPSIAEYLIAFSNRDSARQKNRHGIIRRGIGMTAIGALLGSALMFASGANHNITAAELQFIQGCSGDQNLEIEEGDSLAQVKQKASDVIYLQTGHRPTTSQIGYALEVRNNKDIWQPGVEATYFAKKGITSVDIPLRCPQQIASSN